MPARPSCSRLMSSQRAFTSPAEDELGVDRLRDRLEVPVPLLAEEEREEVDLEEQVAQLVEQLLGPVGKGGVRDLVRLLDRVRDNRPGRLLAIPRAVAA